MMMEGEDWDGMGSTHTPQHEHQSDDEADEETGRLPVQELGYHSKKLASRRRAHNEDNSTDVAGGVYRGGQELHHRQTTTATRTTARPHNRKAPRHVMGKTRHGSSKRKRVTWSVLFIGGAVLVVVYVALMMHMLSSSDPENSLPPFDRRGVRATRLLLDKKRVDDRAKAQKLDQERAAQRMHYTRPPPTTTQVPDYTLLPLEEMPSRPVHPEPVSFPAHAQDLCGTHAKNAALHHPYSYLGRDALNSKSRVMITGILNPVGFHLALTLKERCNVQVITGIDPMFPNTVSHRLALQKRIQLLTTSIPKLVQPIVLPLVGLDPRWNKNQKNEPTLLPMTGELSLLNFRPTHIVHLASYSPDEYMDPLHPDYWNTQSPYVTSDRNAPLYRIRSSLVSMEQILASISNSGGDVPRPHFLYASSSRHDDAVHTHLKHADELLTDTYSSLHGAFSLGLRLPNAIYGPWGRAGGTAYQMADAAVAYWNRTIDASQLLQAARLENVTERVDDFLYVSDAVDVIIAAMQYRPESGTPALLEASPESSIQLSSAASAIVNLKSSQHSFSVPSFSGKDTALMQETSRLLGWKSRTDLRSGLIQTLAWHLDKDMPFGQDDSSKAMTIQTHTAAGDAFLLEHGAPTCAVDDTLCHFGKKVLPCASECATKANCIPSIFDDVADLTREVTEQCDVILYTQSLGYNVQDMKLKAMYSDEGEQIVCNFAFIPRNSKLVDSVIKKVPNEQLVKFGITPDSKGDLRERKQDGLNGRLLYKGWILIWVKDAVKPLSTFDNYLLKLNPGKFFSKDVKRVLYVDEHFPVSPNLEDVLFLMGEVHRKALGFRSVYQKDENGKKHKYKLQPEPERRAVMLLAPLKQRVSHNTKETALADGQRLTVYTATKFMRYEIGEDATQKETPVRKKQREFYERVPTFVNRVDLRSPNEPWYRYEMKHWIRTRWVVHDMELAESRDLRCDWYTEHVQWGNDLDQLSFAHVMARRELERRIAHQELDDHVKPPHVEHPELKLLSDAHEWHPYVGKEHRLDSLGTALFKVPEHMLSKDEAVEEGAVESEPVVEHDQSVPLFVRIMSERVMMLARHKWAQVHGKKNKKKRKRNHN